MRGLWSCVKLYSQHSQADRERQTDRKIQLATHRYSVYHKIMTTSGRPYESDLSTGDFQSLPHADWPAYPLAEHTHTHKLIVSN